MSQRDDHDDQKVHSDTSAAAQALTARHAGRPAAKYLRELALGSALLLGAVLLALRSSGAPGTVAALAVAVPAAQGCDLEAPALIDANGATTPLPASVTLYSNVFLRVLACGPAGLTVQATGSTVEGVGARLVVAWQGTTLYDEAIDGDRSLSLQVPGAGWVVLAFVNDRHEPPADRNLRLTDITLRPTGAP